MKAADLNRFLVVCALGSDLYSPGYNPRQSLAKNSNLARAATRYRVDSSQIVAGVRMDLANANNKRNREPNPKKMRRLRKKPNR